MKHLLSRIWGKLKEDSSNGALSHCLFHHNDHTYNKVKLNNIYFSKLILDIIFFNSFIIQTRDDKQEIFREVTPWGIILHEGEHLKCQRPNNPAIPESITVKIEVMEPSIDAKKN